MIGSGQPTVVAAEAGTASSLPPGGSAGADRGRGAAVRDGDANGAREASPGGPAIRIQHADDAYVDALATEAGFLQGLVELDGKPLCLEGYQTEFLDDTARKRWVTKARQVGFSFIIALEALARCHLRRNYTAHIVSFSQAEAKEKILIARQAYESMGLGVRKKLVIDSRTELGFEGSGGDLSRILVHPSKAPRGRKGDIYLDELAHYLNDRDVHKGSTALIAHGGQMTGCSTPLGRRGVFWEIARQEQSRHPDYHRQEVPWWLATFFCSDVPAAAQAGRERLLSTTEMVEQFGTEALIDPFRAVPLEDFEQEFCCSFSEASLAFLPYDLILPCTSELPLHDSALELPRPRGRYVAGYDVGRRKDRSVLAVFDEHDSRFSCCMLRTFTNMPFDDQEGELRRLLNTVPLARLSIDRTGMGMHLVENLERAFPNVVGETFTNDAKERWATNVKILLQQENLALPRDRQLVADFHAIKKKILASGKISFDADHTAGGHADGFWAVALAVQREVAPPERRGTIFTVRILG